jgi:hypothetical protein
MLREPDHEEIIRFIFEQFDNGIDEAKILSASQTRFSIDFDTASWAIEMAQTGRFRSGFIKAGKKYPKSNVDNDPFLKEAIRYCLP